MPLIPSILAVSCDTYLAREKNQYSMYVCDLFSFFFLLSTSTAELLIFGLTLCWVMQIDKHHINLGCFQPLFTIFHAAVDSLMVSAGWLKWGAERGPLLVVVLFVQLLLEVAFFVTFVCLWLAVCLCIWFVCLCVCVRVHACAHTCMHLWCVCMCVHAHMHLWCVWECVCMRVHMRACIYGVCGGVYLCLAWVFVCVQTEHQHACQNLCNFECFETWFTDFFHWNFVHISFKILQQQSLDPLVFK